MLAVRTPVVDLSAMLVRAFLPALRGARTLLQSLALALLLLCVSGASWAQLGTSTTPVIQAPPGTNYLPPPPDDPEPPAPYDAATGVSISAPSTMAPGSTAYVTVTIRNSGTTTWYPGLSYPYRLGSQNPQDNTTWGMGRVDLGSTVAPGGQAVFGFTITAPTTPGTYTFGWAMLREGMHWFGGNIASTITVAVPAPVYDAQLVSASVPTTMTPGGGYNVSMTFRNSGNTTWTSPDFMLATPDDNVAFGLARVAMSPATVAPGQNATFNFQVSAPSSAGTYTFQWGMVWEFHQRFGQYSTTSITVGGTNGAVTYIHTDGLGSPVARTDSAGNVISRTRYEPYGYVASGVQPTIGFTGHVNDVDTGLTYMQQRYYDPVAGRFLSIDPLLTDANTGSSFNRYDYANNNPYKFIDPDGRDPELPSFFALSTFEAAKHNTTLDQAVRAGALTRTITMPAVGIAAAPSAIGVAGTGVVATAGMATEGVAAAVETVGPRKAGIAALTLVGALGKGVVKGPKAPSLPQQSLSAAMKTLKQIAKESKVPKAEKTAPPPPPPPPKIQGQ